MKVTVKATLAAAVSGLWSLFGGKQSTVTHLKMLGFYCCQGQVKLNLVSAGGLLSKLRSETIPLWACWCFEPLWGVFKLKPEQQQCIILVQVIQQTDTTDCQSNSTLVAWVPFRYYELKPWFLVKKALLWFLRESVLSKCDRSGWFWVCR